MKKKAWYLIAILAVALALLGPAAYAHWSAGQSPQGSPAASSAGGDLAAGPEAGPPVSAGPGSTAPNDQAPGNQPAPAGLGGAEQPEKPGPDSQPHNSPPAAGQPGAQPPEAGGEGQDQVAPAPPPANPGCRVYVAVVGKERKLLFGPKSVTLSPDQKWGVTALGALHATGLSYRIDPKQPEPFVNLVNKEANQGPCGWMYKVNDKTVWQSAANARLKPGDKVVWWYSQGPSWDPTWAELEQVR